MLYLLHGTDREKILNEVKKLQEMLLKKRPDSILEKFHSERWSVGEIEEYARSEGLFGNKYIIILDSLFSLEEGSEKLFEILELLKDSPNIFFVLESKLDKKTLSKIDKFAERVTEYSLPAADKEYAKFSIFSLADALGARDKKNAWILYQKAKVSGLEDEQIHGTLLWQVRSMRAASKSNSPAEAGLSPFVYQKSKRYSSNFTSRELEILGDRMVEIFHTSRFGGTDLGVFIERELLSL